MLDQLIIGSTSSLDYDASVAERVIGQPTKKEIKSTIPFSNITYDFSAINGELYWNERELTYVLEIIADSPEELEEKKTLFAEWVMNVLDEKIHDPFITEYHFKGSFSELSFADEDDVEKTTATVKFMVYPYKIANAQKVYIKTVAANGSDTLIWDGDTTGCYVISDMYYRVSEETPSMEDLANGGTVIRTLANGSEESYPFTSSDLTEETDGIIKISESVYIVPESSSTLHGIYFGWMESDYISSITINGYDGFPPEDETGGTMVIINNSSHRLYPIVTVDGKCTLLINNKTRTLSTGVYTGEDFCLKVGFNPAFVRNKSTETDCTVKISFAEEVF